MNNSEISDPVALEVARLEKRKAQLESALLKGSNTNQGLTYTSPLQQAASQQANSVELDRVQAELSALRNERDVIEEEAAKVIADAIGTSPARNDRRASLIKSALLMARITEYDNVNKIAGIEIERIGNVNTGDILGIRRNSGIIGRLTIGTIDRNQGIADPVPGSFMGGNIDIQPGDELILPPN
ncbi:MAG: hypothetical protein ABGY95_11590 [Rubritalea sp.]|uniref:hypothetical protein n=1 Tax=Rubritalea sp. TaxID=2109375 RepID=UPI0032422120